MTFQHSYCLLHFPDKFQPSDLILSGKQTQINVSHRNLKPRHHCGQIRHKPVLISLPTIYHILPYHDTKTVTMIIPSLRFDLNMLAYHVKSSLFHFCNIKDKCLITRWCIQSLRPVSLIQHTILKLFFSIQTDTWKPFCLCIRLQWKLLHGEITDYLIFTHCYFVIIQIRFFTCP